MIETFTLESISPEVRQSIKQARNTAMNSAFPRDKNTKVGCILESPEGNFFGSNIKRWSWNNNTCAERMAIDQALFAGVSGLKRITVYGINQREPSKEVTSPCGPCREIIKETIHSLSQDDVEIVMTNADLSRIAIAQLTDLLPL